MTRQVRIGRGQVVVHIQHRSDWVSDEPGRGHAVERDEARIGLVTSVTRDGVVKLWKQASLGEQDAWSESAESGPAGPHGRYFRGQMLLVPGVSADDALKVARAHHFPGHPRHPMPFGSLDEVRDALRPYARVPSGHGTDTQPGQQKASQGRGEAAHRPAAGGAAPAERPSVGFAGDVDRGAAGGKTCTRP